MFLYDVDSEPDMNEGFQDSEPITEESTTEYYDDVVVFNSETDATMYTVFAASPPTSSAAQQTVYLLEIRNILLIFMLGYFCLIFYSKIKNTFLNFFDM